MLEKVLMKFLRIDSRPQIGRQAFFAVHCRLLSFAVPCLLSTIYCLLPTASFAAFSGADKGTSSGQFLKLGAGARAAGMGEAYSAVADEASAIYWNPAALTRINGFSATFMHAALLADISYEFLGYGQKLGDRGALGLGVQYLSMPAFHETAPSGFETGTSFNPKDTGVTLACSFRLSEKYSAGISGKYIRSGIDKSASTFAADLGVLGAPFRARGADLWLSLVVQNLGGKLKFEQKSDPLPLNVKLGSSLNIMKNWLIGLDVNFPRDNRPYAALGTEYRLAHGADMGFAGRAGFNSRTLGDIGGFNGVSAGAGLDYKQFGLDYAFLPFGAIGMTHRISVTVGFGKPKAAEVPNAELENKSAAPGATVAGEETAGPEIRTWLMQLKSSAAHKRRKAAFELGKFRSVEAVKPLLELLDDENDMVCGAAARALGRIGDKRAFKPLIEALEDGSAYVRASAAKGLQYLKDGRAKKTLKKALKEEDSPDVKKAIEAALKSFYRAKK